MAVLSLEDIRRKNLLRLQGEEGAVNAFVPWTAAEIISSAEKCWEVISLCTRKKPVVVTAKTGSTYKKDSNELQYPIYHAAVVGEKVVVRGSGDEKERVKIERDNIATMRELYQMRNKIAKLYATEKSEHHYAPIYASIAEALDVYATQVVSDELQYQEGFLDKLNEARKMESIARSEAIAKGKGGKTE